MEAYQQVIAAWNAQADEHNQWDALGEDEKIEWALKCADHFRGATEMIQTEGHEQQALDRDAARYRWLRSRSKVVLTHAWFGGVSVFKRGGDFIYRDEALEALDSAIDADIAAQAKQGEANGCYGAMHKVRKYETTL